MFEFPGEKKSTNDHYGQAGQKQDIGIFFEGDDILG